VPRATYRLQLGPGFGFAEAAALTGYLAELGVSHLYASPYLQAAAGSTHGYDVVDHGRVNEELGGADGHRALCRALDAAGLGQVVDVVANHMAVSESRNAWWWDVLENGASSRFAGYFDVDWNPPEKRLSDKVLLPILGDHYGRVVERHEIRLERVGARFSFRYYEHELPASPRSVGDVLSRAAVRCRSDELAFLGDSLDLLPLPTATDWRSTRRRHRDKEVIRGQLASLLEREPEVRAAVDRALEDVNADPDALDRLLERQNYRVAFWRAASRDLDYRRFFDIDSLVGLRVEDAAVFADTHRLVLRWLRAGSADGLRIDHPDGLRDPEQYLRRLRKAAPQSWIVVEKILHAGEELPGSWPAQGTTGYDFLNVVGGIFVDPGGEEPLTRICREFTGEPADWDTLVRETKQQVMREILGSDVNRLTELMMRVCERHRRWRDYTRHEVHEMLREVIAAFPVYRTYVRPGPEAPRDADRRVVTAAIERARDARPDVDPELFDFFRDLLLLRWRGTAELELMMRFQQTTGPVTAKGVEDTAFYRYGRLISLNEVGGDPSRFGTSVEEFHADMERRQSKQPLAMLATSTHDTKRSEGVRARLALLSEIPREWADAVRRWSAGNECHRTDGKPDRSDEYHLYQTLVGAWPIETERVETYVEKAIREAKVHTSWTRQDAAYEEAARSFVRGILADDAFRADLERFVAPLVEPGRVNVLAQTLVKATAPGVPDFYQGTELWSLSLVDPDNRRPVDFDARRRLLEDAKRAGAADALARMDEGLPQLWLVLRALAFRRRHPELFGPEAGYRRLAARGPKAEHVVAYGRGDGAVVVVPRLPLRRGADWGDTALELPPGNWTGELAEGRFAGTVHLQELLAPFPVALLGREVAA